MMCTNLEGKTNITGLNMEGDEFNFHRIVKCEKNVTQPALRDLFETLWNRKYHETPWAKNAASVELFEEKEDEHFKKSLQGLSKEGKRRKINKRKQLQSTFRDNEWGSYEWDISKFAYALVDSKLFELDETDKLGMSISEHIVQIKYIRNNTAHFKTMHCNADDFEKTLKSIEGHLKAFELVGVNVSSYIANLQELRRDEKPVSSQEWFEMRTQIEKLKSSQQVYEEREKRYKVQEQLSSAERKNALQKQHHSRKLERIRSDNAMKVKKLKAVIKSQRITIRYLRKRKLKSAELGSENRVLQSTIKTRCKSKRIMIMKVAAIAIIGVLRLDSSGTRSYVSYV